MKRSGFAVMARLIGLVGPLTGTMLLAIFRYMGNPSLYAVPDLRMGDVFPIEEDRAA